MKALTLTLSLLFILTNLFAQKIELSVQASSAFLHYSGKSTTSETFINGGATPYTNNPYGKQAGFGYNVGLQAQYVSKGGFIAGIQAAHDRLRSKVNITGVTPPMLYPYYDIAYVPLPAKGQTYLTSQSININPYLGYRLNIKKVKLDLMPGIDIGFNLSLYDKGSATTTGDHTTYKINYKKTNAPTDVRIKFGAAASYKRYSITASFARGLTNYESRMIGDGTSVPSYEAHSELFKLGIGYRIN